jgi:hypothetical protein
MNDGPREGKQNEDDQAPTPLKTMATEVMAGFSAACLLTLALISQPLNLVEKISIFSFSMALPMLVWARVGIEHEENATVLSLCARLRYWGYILAVVGFGFLLGAVYWPASILFGITGGAALIAWSRALHANPAAKGVPGQANPVPPSAIASTGPESVNEPKS